MAYIKTVWVNGTSPAISDTNLNKIEQGIYDSLRQDGTTAMSAQLVTVAGDATTPAIAPTGDSNNGIFFPAADTIALGTAGSERVRVNSSGQVGIGCDPTSTLEAKGAQGTIKLASTTGTNSTYQKIDNTGGTLTLGLDNSTGSSQFGAGNYAGGLWHSGNYNLTFGTNATCRMTITGAGNVGIGTSTPDVFGRGYSGTIVGISSSGQSAIQLNSATGNATYLDLGVNGSRLGYIQAQSTDLQLISVGAIPLYLGTNNAVRATITSAGNVGIGTNSPSAKLELSDGTITLQHDLVAGGGYVGTKSNHPLVLFTNNTEKMRLTTAGYALIGYTTSNGAYPLQVNGQIFATSSTIATSDARYKENITPLTGALNLVNALNPVQFDWKQHQVHNFNTEQPTVGFLAQEVAEVLKDQPYLNSVIKKSECTWETETGEFVDVVKQVEVDGELVDETVQEAVKETHTEEFFGIAESNLIAILTKAVQELSAEVQALKAQIAGK